MAQRTQSEIVAFAAGGVVLVALASAAAWTIFAQDASEDRAAAFAIEFAAPAGSRVEAVDAEIGQRLGRVLAGIDGVAVTT
jgi:hypothetical protein